MTLKSAYSYDERTFLMARKEHGKETKWKSFYSLPSL